MEINYTMHDGRKYDFNFEGDFAKNLLNIMDFDLDRMFTDMDDFYNKACDQADAVAQAGGFKSSWYFKDDNELARFHHWLDTKASEELRKQYEEAGNLEYKYGCKAAEKLEKLEEHLLEALKLAEELETEYNLQ